MPSRNAQNKSKSQRQAFIAAAKKAECDESEAAFEWKLRKIAKATPKEPKPKR